MEKHAITVLYVVLLVAVIVSMDFLFFKDQFRERLIANIAVVLIFAAFYFGIIRPR